jgi:hypothetical protein
MQKAGGKHDPKTRAEISDMAERASAYFSRLLSADRIPVRVSETVSEDGSYETEDGSVKVEGLFIGKADTDKNEIIAAKPDPNLVSHEVSHLYYAARHKKIENPFEVGQTADREELGRYFKDIMLETVAKEGFAVLAGSLFHAVESKHEYGMTSKTRVMFFKDKDPATMLMKEIDDFNAFLSDGFKAFGEEGEKNALAPLCGILQTAYHNIATVFIMYYLGKSGAPAFSFGIDDSSFVAEISRHVKCRPNITRLERLLKAAYNADVDRLAHFIINREIKERRRTAEALRTLWKSSGNG